MYTPPAFDVRDRDWAMELIGEYPFGMLVTVAGGAPQITHLPMLAEMRDGALWVTGHLARANPHAQIILEGTAKATVVFQGPHAYISAGWYEEPYQTVPTWDYAAVHCDGVLVEGDAYRTLELLTAKFEAGRSEPWEMARLDIGYLEKQLRGIVAFELRVDALRATAKLSQNRTRADRERVIAALAESPYELDRACGAAISDSLKAG